VVASLGVADLGELVEYLRHCETEDDRRRAARVIQAMLRSQAVHPLVTRAVLQAIVPGLVAVARRLRWGSGGDWDDAGSFLADAIATAWEVIVEWSGVDRDYAVLDLLSAIRCRMRRQMVRQRTGREKTALGIDLDHVPGVHTPGATGADELVRAIEQMGDRLDPIDAALLYANRVLGLTVTELARMSGRTRRSVAGRRDRAVEELLHVCA
jgi:DNA-directed RNA polymerase specialized sigma24 family protein